MISARDWRPRGLLLGMLLGLLLAPAHTHAQAQLVGDGIKGDYYSGPDFDQYVLSRRDATLAFDWGLRQPAPGVPAESFSVRWRGWLVPPVSGRYLFHVTVDDGVRIWLNDKLIMNEWRPQPVHTFTAAVELQAGEPYKLRVEYYQDILDTRFRVTWERPDVPLAPPPASWRNLWGLTADAPKPEPISTQYLFSRNPRPAVAPTTVLVAPPPVAPPAAKPPLVAKAAPASAPRPRQPAVQPLRRELLAPRPVAPQPAARLMPPPAALITDSGSARQLTHLAVGEAVVLPDLYFDQGQARLLPPARAALDKLAGILAAQRSLRFEVQGHTDNVGSTELNRQLSQQRADAVCLYLTAHGVATAQLRAVGLGGTQPVADNADPAQRPRNRRVALRRL